MKPEANSKQQNQGELFRNRLDQMKTTFRLLVGHYLKHAYNVSVKR
ncbi:hypothetical protein LEP1GSC082_2099 [Leptospira kirschneri str. H2]|nr:hypothetical protein LEP1GSC082_2099 [Leptospira kirschneri str. H2]